MLYEQHLLILQIECFGNVHALQPADIAVLVSCLGKGLLEGMRLLQAHDVERVPSPSGEDV